MRPSNPTHDLLDREPVRLCVEGDLLVGHGFGRQRVAIPLSSVKALGIYSISRPRGGPRRGLVVLDGDDRILLRAPGAWGEDGTLWAFGRKAGLQAPQHRFGRPLWRRARGCRRLRTRPRGSALAAGIVLVAVLAAGGYGGAAGVFLAGMLPESFGAVRFLIDAVALVTGLIAGLGVALKAVQWTTVALKRVARLLVRSLGRPVPPERPARPAPAGQDRRDWSAFSGLAVLGLAVFGPVVLATTITGGVRDAHLLDRLRHHGVTVTGEVYDHPTVSTGAHGDISVSHHPQLTFVTRGGTSVTTRDPVIDGHRYDKDGITETTIVYDPARPTTAAVREQLKVSPWAGGRTGNLVSGSALTVVLIAYLPIWLRRRRLRGPAAAEAERPRRRSGAGHGA
ncbi:DUF3592 domain-containing protein [Actinomadura sp. RB99]|uniref:DUF3592 domain-containing protein n=1 Tax=Actinomadura sp. RB99 TaxID=2691577 RepID=UPI00168286AB|nr:DUF3592 domain-containing protein [Actinomadura sp. RB99]